MKRVLLVATLAVASALAPAYAAGPPKLGNPGGYCDGDVDVACRRYPCQPDMPCTIEICGIYLNGKCS